MTTVRYTVNPDSYYTQWTEIDTAGIDTAGETFGLIAVAMTTILALEVIKDLGTGAAVIQRPNVDQRLLSSTFHLNVTAGLVAGSLMALGAPLIADLFDTPSATPVVRALSLVLVLGGLSQTHHAVMRRKMRLSSVAAVEMTGALVNGGLSIALALGGWPCCWPWCRCCGSWHPAGALGGMLSVVNTLYSAKGRADQLFRWGLTSGLFSIAMFALGLQWGLNGLAVTYLLVMIVLTPVGFAFVLRLIETHLSDMLRSLAPYFLMTAAMSVAAGAAT